MLAAGYTLSNLGSVSPSRDVVVFEGDINGDSRRDKIVQTIGHSPSERDVDKSGVTDTKIVLGAPHGDVVLHQTDFMFPHGWPVASNRTGSFTRFRFRLREDIAVEKEENKENINRAADVVQMRFFSRPSECRDATACAAVAFSIGDLVQLPGGGTGRISDFAIDVNIRGRVVGSAAYYISGNHTYEQLTGPVALARLKKVEDHTALHARTRTAVQRAGKNLAVLVAKRAALEEEIRRTWRLQKFFPNVTRAEEEAGRAKSMALGKEKEGLDDHIATIIADAVGRVVADGFGCQVVISGVVHLLKLADLEHTIDAKLGLRS